ncbi:MAG: hypothetical protein IKO55_02470 [Kiritimatiellae bacterium]|nr:hypothetical protein [Kiritimatiellia bacterium]
MNKMIRTVLIVLVASILGPGCCTTIAMANDNKWAVPATVPVDAALLPVEFVALEVTCFFLTGGQAGFFGLMNAFSAK